MSVFKLTKELIFPSAHLAEREGLLAVGGDLSCGRLLLAYRMGIFPWYNDGDPILWWSPDPRLLLFPDEFHVARRMQRVIRQGRFRITFDTAFARVIRACAETPRTGHPGTWIVQDMMDAYGQLYDLGYAHSVECWRDGELAGGIYGCLLYTSPSPRD